MQRYPVGELMPAYVQQRDHTETDLAALNATIQVMIKPVIEQILESTGHVGNGNFMLLKFLHQSVERRLSGITEQDVSRTLTAMDHEGWVEFDGFWCRLRTEHKCDHERDLYKLGWMSGRPVDRTYQCTMCGVGWRYTEKRRLGRKPRVKWQRGVSISHWPNARKEEQPA